MPAPDRILQKQKYFEKVLSNSAIYLNFIRTSDEAKLFSSNVWLEVPAMDWTVLGLGTLNAIDPIVLEPVSVLFEYQPPSLSEMEQGIWANFVKVDMSALYRFMIDLRDYIIANFNEAFQEGALFKSFPKAYYDNSYYGRALYDPVLGQEVMRATVYRLRFLRKPDVSYLATVDELFRNVGIVPAQKEHVYNRMALMIAAQEQAFVLGLGVLGKSRLTRTEGDWGIITTITANGSIRDVKFRTLDHLQLGLILGLVPLGQGYLLTKQTVYRTPDGKKNPPIIDVIMNKTKKIARSIYLSSIAFGNYNKPDEMTDYHKSERTAQYDILQWDREFIERWVTSKIPPEEANSLRIRQYINAVLQLLAWPAKRHVWGFDTWKFMTDEEFKAWWVDHWKRQGLNEVTLNTLFEGIKEWLPTLRRRKLELGERVKTIRQRLAQTTLSRR